MAFYLEDRTQLRKVIPEKELREFCEKNGPKILLLVLDVCEGSLLPGLIAQNKIPSGIMDPDGIGRRENMFLLLPEVIGLQVITVLQKAGIHCIKATNSFECPIASGEVYAAYLPPPI